MDFIPGQRVMCINDAPYDNDMIQYGDYGTVASRGTIAYQYDDDDIPVCWDHDVGGHNLERPEECEWGHGWWTPSSYITIIEDEDSFDDFEFPSIMEYLNKE